MKEKEISNAIAKFERLIGPVARAIADESAEDLGILKGDKISPSSQTEHDAFMKSIKERYSKILGKPLVEKMLSE